MKRSFFEVMNEDLAEEELKEAEQYNQRELENSLSSEKQLTGVDLVNMFKKDKELHSGNKTDSKNKQSTIKSLINDLDSIDELEDIIKAAHKRLESLKLSKETNISIKSF